MKRMFRQDLREASRLQYVVQLWRQQIAGASAPSQGLRSGSRPGYVWTEEWKEDWLKIVRDEISKRRNSTSTESSSTLSLSTTSEDTGSKSGEEMKELSTKLSEMDKLGAVRDWVNDETHEA